MSEESVELVRRMIEAVSRGDMERAFALADPPADFEFIPSGVLIPDLSTPQHGPAGLRRILYEFFGEFEDFYFSVHELIAAGDQVFVAFTMHGRGKHSGAETTMDGWTVWTVRDGRAARILGFTDREPALEAAGLKE
jgi:ketosteroid isomerase-like protein